MGVKTSITHERIDALFAREQEEFARRRPRSRELFEAAKGSLPGGVPMNWMRRWPGGFPAFITQATGSKVIDVDGHEYVDLCLGDTGAMAGHAPPPTTEVVAEQVRRGITAMLPTEDALWVGRELTRRFKVSRWQLALTATDANRFALRLARRATGRPRVLVFNWCYHGSVDESLATLADGRVSARRGNVGPAVDPAETTAVVEFNDPEGLERELARGDIACVLAEPALTNIGIVLPEPGFHDQLRELTRRYGTLLIIDETHTFCAGPGGCTAAWDLDPDIVTIGKAIAGGVPAAAYGFTESLAAQLEDALGGDDADVSGIGGTLAGNALSLAAIRATLENVLTDDAFERMIGLGERLESGVQEVIDEFELPWHVVRLGCRIEYAFGPEAPVNGGEAAELALTELDRLLHLYMMNRGVLITPFHNMALASPATTDADVDRHTEVLREAARELVAG